MKSSAPVTRAVAFRKAGAREIAALAVVAWLLPLLVHLVPWSGERPLGAQLLPMFWATLVAGYFYGPRVAVLVGLVAPAVNLAATGLPALGFLGVLAFELVVFALVTTWAIRRTRRFFLIAPLGYLVAKVASMAVQAATGVWSDVGAPLAFFGRSVSGALPGLVVLAAIHAALAWFYPKGRVESDDAAAV